MTDVEMKDSAFKSKPKIEEDLYTKMKELESQMEIL